MREPKATQSDKVVKLTRPVSHTHKEPLDGGEIWSVTGWVETQHGIVQVYSRIDYKRNYQQTELYFALNGHRYVRTINDFYQPTYLTTLANRFAAAVVAGEVQA